jgi:hypothetical protein
VTIGGFQVDLAQVATLLAALGTLFGQVRQRVANRAKARTLAVIEHEVKPNGGASLRDAVNRIEAKVGTLADRIVVLEQRPRSLWNRRH